MFSTVIFDLDGTLLNTIDDLADAGNAVCLQNGWPQFSVAQFKKMVGNGIPKLVWRFSPPQARTEKALANTLAQFTARYKAHMQDKTAPYPGIEAMLQQLSAAGVQLAVLSNKENSLANKIVADYFAPCFAQVRGALPDVKTKPDPVCVHRLMEQLGAEPATTLFVGDSDVDMLTAKNAGLTGCGVLWGFRDKAELTAAGADRLAADPQELTALILG